MTKMFFAISLCIALLAFRPAESLAAPHTGWQQHKRASWRGFQIDRAIVLSPKRQDKRFPIDSGMVIHPSGRYMNTPNQVPRTSTTHKHPAIFWLRSRMT